MEELCPKGLLRCGWRLAGRLAWLRAGIGHGNKERERQQQFKGDIGKQILIQTSEVLKLDLNQFFQHLTTIRPEKV
jgi:hypothetical protein